MPGALVKVALCLPVLLLLGCQSSSETAPVYNQTPVVSTNAALFDPTGDAATFIPLPNILATATAADPLAGRAVNTAMTPPEALAYVNQYEMGSTQAVSGVNAPIYLRFTYPVDPKTVTPATVKVFQITADSASPSATENNPLGFTDISTAFTYQLAANGTDLELFPNYPLLPGTRYAYVVTNQVMDLATEAPIIPSIYFSYLMSPVPLTGATAALEPIRANTTVQTQIALSGYYKTMSDMVAASKTTSITSLGEIAVMGRFITSGAGYLVTDPASPATSTIPVESAFRAFAAMPIWNDGITITAAFTKGNANPALTTNAIWTAILTGEGIPAAAQPTVPTSLGAVVLGTINSANLALDPVVVAANAATETLTGAAATAAYNPIFEAGVIQSFRNAKGQWLGYYNVPTTIPFVYLAPAATVAMPKPANGWPLVIYQHGIGSSKESVTSLAQALTGNGFAVVAIDLPLHNANAITGHTTPTQWVQDFMAVGAPLSTRSNIQQAAFNLHRLELTEETGGFATALTTAGLGAFVSNINPTTTKFVGISLGSIVGAYYLAGNTQVDGTTGSFTTASVNASMKAYLSVPGGRTAYLIQNSPAFSGTVNAGLAAMGINVGTPTYNEFFQVTQSVVDIADPATMTTPISGTTVSRLAGRVLIEEDTNTYDASGAMLGGDLVIPNANTRYFGNALGGDLMFEAAGVNIAPGFGQVGYTGAATPTIPVQFMYGLTATGSVVPDDFMGAIPSAPTASAPTQGYFQFNQPGVSHGSLLDPTGSATATGLIQTQMVYFLLGGIVVDPTQN